MACGNIDFSDPSWHWAADKFDLDMAEVTGSLHDSFNTYALPLQDFGAFFRDVKDIAEKAPTLHEFKTSLRKRQEQRQTEIQTSFDEVALGLTGRPDLLPNGSWGAAVSLFNSRSLDAAVTFLRTFTTENETATIQTSARRKVTAKGKPVAKASATGRPMKNTARLKDKPDGKSPSNASATQRMKRTEDGRIHKQSRGGSRYALRRLV